MKPSNQSNADDRAVSPVVGVILMVAITVILAAVIGTFVLGLGDQLGDTAPQASFDVDSAGDNAAGDTTLNITKTGGQDIPTSDLVLSIDGVRYDNATVSGSGDWQTGETRTYTEASADDFPSGEATVQIVHDPSGNVIFEATADFST
ncbi:MULTISPECIES: type IV pilin [unclassified Halorubrum]|uniref:type IV pilin n=1 Tax=unclassified Halorubrum TaxID=2642239 RepID=UPI0018EEBA94|nr:MULTISPECIES: type IV pilin N-terminal domain-containing protein [unclassified Halorubrum]